jgi:hypothetical protein
MALLDNKNFEFTGSIGDLSVYKMHGVEKPVVRTKGGADKKKILSAPEFELTRQNATEYGACGATGGAIRRSMLALGPIADYNFTPTLNALAKIIQHYDTDGKRGQRSVFLSRHKNLLNGFSLNRKVSLESIVKHPIEWNLEREAGKAHIEIAALTPGVNLIIPKQYSVFRFVITLGTVADRIFQNNSYLSEDTDQTTVAFSDWFHAGEAFAGVQLSIQLKYPEEISDNTTLIVGAGIQMGVPLTPALVNPVKRAGAAKVIAVG